MTKMLSNEDRIYLVRSYREKALESLGDARDLLALKPGLSARMSYEAAYHFTVAFFVSEGIIIPKTHRGLNSELYRIFVEKGLFPREIAAYLGQLEIDRNTAQYDPIEKIFAEDAKKTCKKPRRFVIRCKNLSRKILTNLKI